MKFTCSVEIDQPIDKVIELFDNPDNLKEWQDGFVSFDHLSGIPGEPGAKSKIIYKNKGQTIELIETLLVKNLPYEMSGTYEHKHMVNNMSNHFKALGDDKTEWVANLEYTKLNGFLPKLMAFIMPGMFRKQTQKWLNQFKTFAESRG